MVELDAIDLQILDLLQRDGRMSNTDLAQRVGLTAPTVLRRVKLLEERGVIRGYAAQVDPLALGLHVTAFIFVETSAGCDLDQVARDLVEFPGIQEVQRLIGEWCFLLKVRTHSPQTLEDLISRVLRRNPSVRRTQSTIATSAAIETMRMPIPQHSHDLEVPYGTEF
ncbi:MAG: Lrp/AsnC family transcriptional regulator [Roseiflexaceae bacterium]|nr:Lrp/AsnC family transcriptional regulator [Roseiflexaceae bacterium]